MKIEHVDNTTPPIIEATSIDVVLSPQPAEVSVESISELPIEDKDVEELQATALEFLDR